MESSGTKNVVLVDENDEVLGTMEKLKAHQKGLLHRAFSVIIFNDQGEMLIHKRASDKYHCGGLWTNACCSHPRLEETTKEAALRRMHEEMGFSTSIEYIDKFIYKAKLENGLTEHELDHIFVGYFNGNPVPNPQEVEDFKYIGIENLKSDIEVNPQKYTVWFKHIIRNHLTKLIAND